MRRQCERRGTADYDALALAIPATAMLSGGKPDAGRDADDIRSRHELAQGQDFGEFLIIHPLPLFDDDAAGPDEPATEPEKGDFEKGDKQRRKRYPRSPRVPASTSSIITTIPIFRSETLKVHEGCSNSL